MTSIGPDIPNNVEGVSINDMSRGATELYQEDLDQVRYKARTLNAVVSDIVEKCQAVGLRPIIMSHVRQYIIYPGPMHERQFIYHATINVEDGDGQRHSVALISSFSCHLSDDGLSFDLDSGAMNDDCRLEYAKLGIADGYPIDDSIMADLTPDECVELITKGKAGD